MERHEAIIRLFFDVNVAFREIDMIERVEAMVWCAMRLEPRGWTISDLARLLHLDRTVIRARLMAMVGDGRAYRGANQRFWLTDYGREYGSDIREAFYSSASGWLRLVIDNAPDAPKGQLSNG